MIKILVSLLVAMMSISACSTELDADTESNSLVLTERGIEKGSEWCSDFDLTSQQAETFLSKAEEVTAQTYHNQYNHLGCYVKGAMNYKGSQCDITIWAGSTAELQCGEKEYLLGCKDCEFSGTEE